MGMRQRVRGWWFDNVATYSPPWSQITRLLFCRPCTPDSDMCRIPSHDYCVICGRSMPGQAPWRHKETQTHG